MIVICAEWRKSIESEKRMIISQEDVLGRKFKTKGQEFSQRSGYTREDNRGYGTGKKKSNM
jgi:hypothetical protein